MARVGVPGTRVVMETGLYGLGGVDLIVPDAEGIAAVGAASLAIAQAGAATAGQRRTLVGAGAALHAWGAEAVLLGGTDLSLPFDGVEAGYPVVDSAVVHVEAIARWAMAG